MNLAKISQKLRIKWNFELTVFELTVPDLYCTLIQKSPAKNVVFTADSRNLFCRPLCFKMTACQYEIAVQKNRTLKVN